MGKLVLVVGPSGAGKDSIIEAARRAFADHPAFVFPKRVITRAPDATESNIFVSVAEFQTMERHREFILAWRAHDCHYGIPRSVQDEIALGHVVIANVSRSIVEEARSLIPDIDVVLVTANQRIREQRIVTRSREHVSEDRLDRDAPDIAALAPALTIENNGSLEQAASLFIQFLQARSPVAR